MHASYAAVKEDAGYSIFRGAGNRMGLTPASIVSSRVHGLFRTSDRE
jgi:hypothetical protein